MSGGFAHAFDDQTSVEWKYNTGYGTGIFIRSGMSGALFEENIRYSGFQDLMQNYGNILAFKWIPQDVFSLSQLLSCSCAGMNCVRTCPEPGCICDPSSGKCVSI